MMKMMILAPRKVGMTHAEFRHYVTAVHGPLVLSVPEVAAGILHYHYNFPVFGSHDPAFGHPLAAYLDIVTQGWFESREAQLENMAQPRYLEVIRPDEGRFANEAGAVMHYTSEHVIVEGAPTMNKVFYFRRRHPSLTREAFQEAWRARFPAALGVHLGNSSYLSRYVQNHAYSESDHPQGTDTKFFDLIDEFSGPALGSLAGLARDPATLERVRRVESELLDTARTRSYIGHTIHNKP